MLLFSVFTIILTKDGFFIEAVLEKWQLSSKQPEGKTIDKKAPKASDKAKKTGKEDLGILRAIDNRNNDEIINIYYSDWARTS